MQSPFRDGLLDGKVALITGGSSGIGYEITRQLGLHGASVSIMGRRGAVVDESAAALASEGLLCLAVQGDVRKYEDCERAVQQSLARYGRLDIVVNCAAGNFLATAEELTSNGFRTVMEIDALGTFNMSRASFPALKESDSATIINISATLHYGATWYQANVNAAKAAVDALTRTMGLEWGAFGIRVNGIAPGPIGGTAGLAKLLPGTKEEIDAAMKESIPLKKVGRKWDIAMAAIFLSSPAAAYMTGATMVVDGGEWMYRKPILPREAVSRVSRGVEASSRSIVRAPGMQSKL